MLCGFCVDFVYTTCVFFGLRGACGNLVDFVWILCGNRLRGFVDFFVDGDL